MRKGDIPTTIETWISSCNGRGTVLLIQLPAGENVEVVKISIQYDFKSVEGNIPALQRSQVYCLYTGNLEPVYAGSSTTSGASE